jgi:aldehyde dehydrogenase (NAD+)
MTLHQNLIAGEWVGGVANINPSNTDDVVGEYAGASAEDAKGAIAAAKAAFPAWSRSGILERHAILRQHRRLQAGRAGSGLFVGDR